MSRHSGTPTNDLADIERHNLPCAILAASISGHTYGPDSTTMAPCVIPEGSKLVHFHRDVVAIWLGKYGGHFPCNVLFPDGRYLYMTADPQQLLAATPEQAPVDWDPETQRYVERAK